MELVGVAEIAEMLGVSKQVVANWRGRKGGFPVPTATLKAGPVWTREAVTAWAISQGITVRQEAVAPSASTETRRPASVAALMNMKGGVGKSTLTANIGWHAAYNRGLRVLLVDLDPQFNLSQYILGVEGYERLVADEDATIEMLFRHEPGDGPVDIRGLIREVHDWNDESCLHLVPASLDLAWSMRLALERAHVLRDALDEIRDTYDLIIIDCAPTESILSTATYFAADWILVPVKPEFLSAIGLPLLLKSIQEFENTHRNETPPQIAGIVFNDVSDRVEHSRSRRYVRETAGRNSIPVFQNEINHSDSYPAGARQGKPIFLTDNARSSRKEELERVGDEFLGSIGL
ncbi:chromosome partitioning protein [Sphingomonas sp. PP-F2F-A104-K0414]|nr:chromosome partitioning protein [Sphingomonas sp. PP-F2F-A104-K0414]